MSRAPYVTLRVLMDGDLRRYWLKRAGVSQLAIADQCRVNRAVVVRVLDDAYGTSNPDLVQDRMVATRDRVRRAIAEAIHRARVWPKSSPASVLATLWPSTS